MNIITSFFAVNDYSNLGELWKLISFSLLLINSCLYINYTHQ